MKTSQLWYVYSLMLVHLLAVKAYTQQTAIYITEGEIVVHQEDFYVNNHAELTSSLSKKNPYNFKKPVIIQNSIWATQVVKLTTTEAFKVRIDDLLAIESVSSIMARKASDNRSWYASASRSGFHWLYATLYWRSATPSYITKYSFSKKNTFKLYNLHIASYYIYSNKSLLNQQIRLQPTSSYKVEILNPQLTSFPPPRNA